jgi:hypothetical protein
MTDVVRRNHHFVMASLILHDKKIIWTCTPDLSIFIKKWRKYIHVHTNDGTMIYFRHFLMNIHKSGVHVLSCKINDAITKLWFLLTTSVIVYVHITTLTGLTLHFLIYQALSLNVDNLLSYVTLKCTHYFIHP